MIILPKKLVNTHYIKSIQYYKNTVMQKKQEVLSFRLVHHTNLDRHHYLHFRILTFKILAIILE